MLRVASRFSVRDMTDPWQKMELAWPRNVVAAAATWAGAGELAWLDSATVGPGAHESLIAVEPAAVLEQYDGRAATLAVGGVVIDADTSAWRLWRRAVGRLPGMAGGEIGLTPGWIGYVGFEAVRQLERLPASHVLDLGLPVARLGLFDRAVVLEHESGRAWGLTAPGVRAALGVRENAAWLERWPEACRAEARGEVVQGTRLVDDDSRARHEAAVRRALEYIAAGDIYQVNLARRMRVAGVGEPLAAYGRLRSVNPAPYAALLQWRDGAVASVSPELFLEVRGDAVRTRPIKGTRPRAGVAAEDEALRRALVASAKEAAELTMVVDLHRNDLGRVCAYGSVQVPHARRVEAHPTVFHTVADVTGRLAPGRDALDLLRACFPAGSISGVPKIRALEIIDELEPVARGVYTGAIGVLGLDGSATFNVAIRTLQIRASAATLYVGGGIVADSDPAAEYDETCAKARGMLRGLGVAPGVDDAVAAARGG